MVDRNELSCNINASGELSYTYHNDILQYCTDIYCIGEIFIVDRSRNELIISEKCY